jgi:hypothetical protein
MADLDGALYRERAGDGQCYPDNRRDYSVDRSTPASSAIALTLWAIIIALIAAQIVARSPVLQAAFSDF